MVRADSADKAGDALFKRFAINATPTILFLDASGAEVDWIVGYDPPADIFHEKMLKIPAGIDTYKAIAAAYAKNPKDVPTIFKLAMKWADRYDEAKSKEFFQAVITLDPQGKAGTYRVEPDGFEVPYTEYAEFQIGTNSIMTMKPDPAPMRAFIAKYPGSKLLKQAYQTLSYSFSYQGTKEESAKFFEEFAGKFPDDPQVLDMWLARINRDKGPFDKGADLAARIRSLTKSNPVRRYNKDVAELYANRNETAKIEDVYGKSFMDNQVTSTAIDLLEYAQFWAGRDANKDGALAMAETALRMKPEMAYIIQQAAGVMVKLGREDKAMEVFGQAWLDKNGGTAANQYSYGAFWSGQGKNMDAAMAALRKAVAMDPDKYYFWSGLATALQKVKKWDEAVQAAEKAVALADDQIKPAMRASLERIKAAQAADKK
jgi:tetratricopeptide (TPR) repeat protein